MSKIKLDKLILGLGFATLALFIVCFLHFWSDHLYHLIDEQNIQETHFELNSEDTKQLLFLSSYAPDFDTFDPQYEGIQKAIEEKNSLVDVFCMNTKKFNGETDEQAFYEYFKTSVSTKKPYDAVIVGDDAALLFAMQYQEELFYQIPIVYFGVNNEETAKMASLNPYIWGFTEPPYLQDTIEMAWKLQPEAIKVLCIYDNTETGMADQSNFFAIAEEFPELVFEGLNFQEHTPDELTRILSGLDKTTILIDLSAFIDADGKYYTIAESIELITSAANTPVYRNGYGGFGLGVAGGKQLDFVKSGYEATKLALSIACGNESPMEEPIDPTSLGKFQFDYAVFQKYDLNLNLIPIDADVIGRPNVQLRAYLLNMGIMLLLVVSLGCFLAYSSIHKKRAVELAEKLQNNVDELSKMEEELRYRVEHDEMTGLLTRNACLERAEEALSSVQKYSVLLLDVDNMKDLNEVYGHEEGNHYLRNVSSKLIPYCEKRNILVGRYGGDEFLLVFPGMILNKDSEVLHDVWNIFHEGITVGNDTVLMQVSAGVAYSDHEDLRLAVKLADAAIDEAKKNGKNQLVFQDEALYTKFESYNLVKKILQDAITGDQFYMVYQPQINCATKKLEGFESLCRIKDNTISPGIFIPIAERYGLIKDIGRVTTRLVVEQLVKWREQNVSLCPISINLSVYQIADMEYVDYLLDLLEKFDVDPGYIVLEITENILLEQNEIAKEIFRRLQDAGIKVHLDDFGTGYSSFGYFSYIDIDVIKIDKSLIDKYLLDKGKVIQNLIRTIHSMDKRVIVEGVEEAWQAEKLRSYQCDIIQGYYFSRPVTPELAVEWTKNHGN